MSDKSEFVSSSSCVKHTVGTNLTPLVSISQFIVLRRLRWSTRWAHDQCLFGVTPYCPTIAVVVAQMHKCVVEVVTVALKQRKSACDDSMEGLFNPILNRNSAEVCGVRHICV